MEIENEDLSSLQAGRAGQSEHLKSTNVWEGGLNFPGWWGRCIGWWGMNLMKQRYRRDTPFSRVPSPPSHRAKRYCIAYIHGYCCWW